MDTLLQEMIAFLQSASPLVWATLMKQVYANAAESILFSVVLFISVLMFIKLFSIGKKMKKKDYLSSWELPYIFGAIGTPVSAILALSLLTSALKHFYNPEYYAIRLILSQLGQ